MIISHKHKFIFVKTRKTAGSSIEKYLYNYLGPDDICTGSVLDSTLRLNINEDSKLYKDGHVSHAYIANNFPKEWQNYFKFAVDRNPWDKLVSAYYWRKYKKPKKFKHGFDHFINSELIKTYNCWNLYANDKVVVDTLINYNTLHDSFLKLPIPYNGELLTTFVKSSQRETNGYKEMYTLESAELVRTHFDNVIDFFGYKF